MFNLLYQLVEPISSLLHAPFIKLISLQLKFFTEIIEVFKTLQTSPIDTNLKLSHKY